MEDNSLTLLLFTLILLSFILFTITDFDIIHPVVVLTGMMTFSVSLATLMSQYWHYTVSIDTALLILSGLLVFAASGLWTSYQLKREGNSRSHFRLLMMSDPMFYACILTLCLMAIFSFKEINDLYNKLEGVQSTLMLRTVRLALERGEISLSRWHIYRQLIATCIAYISAFILINNYLVMHVIHKKYFILIVLFFPFLILSTGRLEMLKFVVYCFFLMIIEYQQKNNYELQSKKNTIVYVVSTSIVFFVSFLLMGFFTGKVSFGGRSPILILAHYGGIQIPALSIWLESVRNENMLVGYMTMPGIYHILNTLGLKLPQLPGFLSFVRFYNIDTNVYTFYRRLIEDFGFISMYLILAVLGLFYSSFYHYVKYREPGVPLMLYSIMMISLIWAINEESFFLIFFNAKTVYQFIFIYTLYHCLYKYDYNYNKELLINEKK